MMILDYGSVCSGIESVSVAVEPLGWQASWFSEIEAFPSAVLAHHYPHVPNLGDMTKIAREVLQRRVHAPSLLVGGTPCQAFSVAGMRAGLADPRGALTIKFVELADAIDHVRPAGDECIVVWENVPGVLSDKGNAFGCFLGALVGESDALVPAGGRWTNSGCVYGPKRAAAWRVLDAQYFGLAQRRRRVFVVASARAGFDPAAVLFERDGVRRDTPPSRGQGQDAAAGTLRSTDGGSDVDHTRANHLIAGTLQAAGKAAGSATQQDAESGLLVVHGTQDPDLLLDQAHPLGRNQGQENAVLAFSCKDYGADAGEVAPTLRAMGHGESHANAGGQVAVCVTGDITHTLKAEGFDASEDGTGRGQPIVPVHAFDARQSDVLQYGPISGPLDTGIPSATAMIGSAVRRLTPRECERLQGFPDDWTLIPWRGKPAEECPDGPRYKAIGNSKAVPVVRWIARRIETELERQK